MSDEKNLLPPLPQPPQRVFVRGPQQASEEDETDAPQCGEVQLSLPGSKYYTLRYLLNALLADGESVVRGPALSDDTATLIAAMRGLGAKTMWERDRDGQGWALRVVGVAGRLHMPPDGVIQVGNAGAVLRLLLGLGALLPKARFETDHPGSLGRRPNADLLAALASLGLTVEAQGSEGLLPITLRGGPPHGGQVRVSGARSSQYLSSLLYLAPLLPGGLEITVPDELRSAPLVRATLRALALAGIRVDAAQDLRHFIIAGGQTFEAREYRVPGDGPSAAALAATALTLGKPLRLNHLDAADHDIAALVATLDLLGATLSERPTAGGSETLTLEGDTRLRGARINGDTIIDSVPVLVAAACFAEGETRFEQVATLRLKESDRIGDLCAELRHAGCTIAPELDAIHVWGRPEGIAGGVTVDGHDDHRLIQALAIAALRSREGLTIRGADAIAKSYPWFFDDLKALGAEVRAL